jgi:tetratricopeptide (TPR) repeat protein
MNSLPEHIPPSYQSYVDLFESDPASATEKLQAFVKKRGNDAVGYYLIAWFQHKQGLKKEAVQNAWKAKLYAPGSPLLEQFHYFLVHPKSLKAWKPEAQASGFAKRFHETDRSHPVMDLDNLIDKLSSVESTRIKAKADKGEPEPDLAEQSSNVDDIVSETLAAIYEKQGNLKAALSAYQKLAGMNGERKGHFEAEAERVKGKISDK